MNLYEKIQAVATEVMGIDKDMNVSAGNSSYKAVSDKSVVLRIKDAEAKYKLISIPYRQELIESKVLTTPPDQYGKVRTTFVDTIKMTTKIVDTENTADFIEVESFGRGVDSSDKGFGKAATYARKYALLNAYKIATGVDPDVEASKPVEQAEQVDIVKLQVENYLLSNSEKREMTLNHFAKGSIDELTHTEITTIYRNLKAKNLL